MKPKQIKRPTLQSATPLSAFDLNKYAIGVKKTLLTPELLEKMATTGR